ncbi:MAG: type IV toxin-antitoxin system AbiEi family antitoxin domain-containing protein [Candidatus Xenobiia bacterium LiM19]
MLSKRGVVKTEAFVKMNISRAYLSKMKVRGLITQTGRGYYTLPKRSISEYHGLVEVSVAFPGGVICLLSALQFHKLTTQNPFKVWVAIGRRDRRPAYKGVPTIIVRYSPACLKEGIERHSIEGVEVRVFNIAKTIADCFKFRNKIGIDVALEALRECLRKRSCSMDDLWHYARICRVSKIMRPYMEALS